MCECVGEEERFGLHGERSFLLLRLLLIIGRFFSLDH